MAKIVGAVIAGAVVAFVALVVIMGGAGMFERTPPVVITQPAQPTVTTPAPTVEPSPSVSSSPEQLKQRSVALRPRTSHTMFNEKLSIKVPWAWVKLNSDRDVDWRYADRSNCRTGSKLIHCPSIRFTSLTNTASPDLLEEWATTPCTHGDKQGQRSGPRSYMLGDMLVDFYTVTCPSDIHPVRYAWHFNAEDVLVTTHAGRNGEVTPEIVEWILAKTKWLD